MIAQFEALVKSLLNQGKTPKQAVEIAYKKYPVMQTMQGEIEDQLRDEMSRGYGMRLDPDDVGEALALSWAEDGLTLSERTTAGSEIVKGFVKSAIADEIRKGTSYTKLARKIFDGYQRGGLIPEQDIPQFMHDLYKASAGPGYTERAFNADFKEVKRYLNKLNTPGMRAAYNALSNAIAERNEEKLDRALYQSTQERTRYYAERIARTEMARAYNDGAMAKFQNDKDVVAVQWKLGSRHPSYDICDFYANADLYGLGRGVFPKDKVPILPAHPHCMCHLRPIVAGQLDGMPKARFEQGAKEYIANISKPHKERLFGVFGAKLVEAGAPITAYLRNYSNKKMTSRLNLPYNKEVGLPEALPFSAKPGEVLIGLGYIPKGTKVLPKRLIAGTGTNVPIHTALPKLMNSYGTDDKWQKWVGTIESDVYSFDIHWYFHRKAGHVSFKLKYRKNKI